MKVTLFLSPSPGWTSLLCPSPCGRGGGQCSQSVQIVSSCCSFLLRFFLCSGISSPLAPVLLWNRFSTWYSSFRAYPPGLGPPWHIPFLAPWSTSVSLPLWHWFFFLFLTPFSFILFGGIFCPFLNALSQKCFQLFWGAQLCLAVLLLEPAGPGAGQPLAFSHRSYSCSPSAASSLQVITSRAGFSITVTAGKEIIALPWRSQRYGPWIVCSLFCADLKCSVLASWVSPLEWNWEKPQGVRNKILEQFSLMKLCECSLWV